MIFKPSYITFPLGESVFVALPENDSDAIQHVTSQGFHTADPPAGAELEFDGVRFAWFSNVPAEESP